MIRTSYMLAAWAMLAMALAGCDEDPPIHHDKADSGVDSGKADAKTKTDAATPDMPKATPDMPKATPDLPPATPDLPPPPPDMPPPSNCAAGGTQQTPTGSGTCAAPYKVDLSGEKTGDVVFVKVAGSVGANEKQFYYPSYSGCNPTSTARDVIFALILPASGVSGVKVTVDPSAGADPISTMLEDQSCGQPANACADANGVNKGECLLAKKGGTGYFGNKPYAVVSEQVHSGKPLVVRFSMVP